MVVVDAAVELSARRCHGWDRIYVPAKDLACFKQGYRVRSPVSAPGLCSYLVSLSLSLISID